jgi:eukaryotic-like serine/threonine-protein kinase
MNQAPDPLIGTSIAGKYKIVQLLGEGGMGCVYIGEQLMGTSVRKVAVKTLHKHLSMDPQIRARFTRECGTVAELEHPNTIQVFDFGTTEEGLLYIVMEFIQGKSVGDILTQEGPMPPERVLKVMEQVCGSLDEAHGRGIVHRDLKPDNVVLCEKAGRKDWVEVLDFGIAKRSSETDPNEAKLTQQGMVLGTPPYMSPEQFTGQPIGPASDIYSLGIMVYEMLTGKLPFAGNTAWELASQHMTARPPPLETQPNGAILPPTMRDAIMRSLEKAPEARFTSAGAFYEALKGNAAFAAAPPAAQGRPKTEMATPAVTPPGMQQGAYTPGPAAYGPPSGQPGQQPGYRPPSGPQGAYGTPPHGGGVQSAPIAMAQPGQFGAPPGPGARPKKSNTGMIVGIGLGAVLLLGGGIGFAVIGGKKTDTPPAATTALNFAPPTTASAAPTASHVEADTPLAALNSGAVRPGGGAGPKTGGSAGPIPTPGKTAGPIPTPGKTAAPIPTPGKTPAGPPPACLAAAKARGTPSFPSLASMCQRLGGTVP